MGWIGNKVTKMVLNDLKLSLTVVVWNFIVLFKGSLIPLFYRVLFYHLKNIKWTKSFRSLLNCSQNEKNAQLYCTRASIIIFNTLYSNGKTEQSKWNFFDFLCKYWFFIRYLSMENQKSFIYSTLFTVLFYFSECRVLKIVIDALVQ